MRCTSHPLHLRPYFGNRALEIARIREQLRQVTDELAPVCHIPGELNPADIGTQRPRQPLGTWARVLPGKWVQLSSRRTTKRGPRWFKTDVLVAKLPPEECMAHCVLVDLESGVRDDGKLGGPGLTAAGDLV